MRRWTLWIAFIICLAVVATAMGWISVAALRLDEAEAKARHQAELEENVRLALWRIDTSLSPLLAQESARPYIAYNTTGPFDPAAALSGIVNMPTAELVSSPLSATNSPLVLVYFQFEPDGRLTSPNVPPSNVGNVPSGAARSFTLAMAISAAESRVAQPLLEKAKLHLAQVAALTDRRRLSALLPPDAAIGSHVVFEQPRPPAASRVQVARTEAARTDRGAVEYQRRSQSVNWNGANMVNAQFTNNAGSIAQNVARNGSNLNNGNTSLPQPPVSADNFRPTLSVGKIGQSMNAPETSPVYQLPQDLAGVPELARSGTCDLPRAQPLGHDTNATFPNSHFAGTINDGESHGIVLAAQSPTELGGGLMTPLWIEGRLLLVRRIAVNGRDYLQGCLLDWPAIKTLCLETVSDLLPGADLLPVLPNAAEDQSRMLAALPLRLVSGPLASTGPEVPSPLRWILPIAWVSVLFAALAVAVLLAGVIRLGQRRADFVSAVTHELRTPLTTFHMYTEMLSEGMVTDPEQQRSYLATLRAEASRLSHLVENVLAFARLERRRINGLEPVAVAQLLECRGRLTDRCRQAEMELLVDATDAVLSMTVRTNPSVIEQILFNLVDNSCKYASAATDKRIRLNVEASARGVSLKVCDHGPGLPPAAARKLFRAFSKSGQEAANTAPGIGLGLALSRRLARDLGGRLSHEASTNPGVTFVLDLPRAATSGAPVITSPPAPSQWNACLATTVRDQVLDLTSAFPLPVVRTLHFFTL